MDDIYENICNDKFMNNLINTKIWNQWFSSYSNHHFPLFFSVDIRDAGFKVSVVDTNLFPSGFNNLCETHSQEVSLAFHDAIQFKKKNCRHVIIIAESHTRNIWYLQSLYQLSQFISFSGYNVRIVSPFNDHLSEEINGKKSLFLKTALGQMICIDSLQHFVSDFKNGLVFGDVIIMNNDLIKGIPEDIMNLSLPVYPTPFAGWHTRRKSSHFFHLNRIIQEFSKEQGIDPWLLSCFYEKCDAIDINSLDCRKALSFEAEILIDKIGKKYREYGIKKRPFIFLKADYGSYGMGVHAISHPKEIIEFNRKLRNKMNKGKNALVINQFILQEGVPSCVNIDGNVGELCLYQVLKKTIGFFYRVHCSRNERENLNAPGMSFLKACPQCLGKDHHLLKNLNIDLYKYLAHFSGIAAFKEVKILSKKFQSEDSK